MVGGVLAELRSVPRVGGGDPNRAIIEDSLIRCSPRRRG